MQFTAGSVEMWTAIPRKHGAGTESGRDTRETSGRKGRVNAAPEIRATASRAARPAGGHGKQPGRLADSDDQACPGAAALPAASRLSTETRPGRPEAVRARPG